MSDNSNPKKGYQTGFGLGIILGTVSGIASHYLLTNQEAQLFKTKLLDEAEAIFRQSAPPLDNTVVTNTATMNAPKPDPKPKKRLFIKRT